MLVPNAIKTLLFVALMAISAGTSQATSDIKAGPVWTQADAERICPVLAKQYQRHWTGHWKTTRQGKISICNLVKMVRDVKAGQIRNQAEAKTKCAKAAHKRGGKWTGQWNVTVQAKMATCEISFV